MQKAQLKKDKFDLIKINNLWKKSNKWIYLKPQSFPVQTRKKAWGRFILFQVHKSL